MLARVPTKGRLEVLREPGFRRLFLGRTTSLVGDGMSLVAIAFAVLHLDGSATDIGVVFAAHSLLLIALVLVAGVVGDRISPRLSMLGADLLRTGAMGLMAALLLTGTAEIWHIAVLYAIDGAGSAFFNPASNAIVPQIVPTRRLQDANALLELSRSLGKVVGPALAGIMLGLGSPGAAIAVDAGTFAISAFSLLGLQAARVETAERTSFFGEMRHGWREFSARSWLVAVVCGAAVVNAIYYPAIQVLGPTVAQESLGGSGAWALIATAAGVGALLGGAVALSIRPRRPLLVGERTCRRNRPRRPPGRHGQHGLQLPLGDGAATPCRARRALARQRLRLVRLARLGADRPRRRRATRGRNRHFGDALAERGSDRHLPRRRLRGPERPPPRSAGR
ncbi:MAG: MFS transporter [Actinobacteria bacterium]|nr:MAG: MFS transporter [Actinomycetota bacterium]